MNSTYYRVAGWAEALRCTNVKTVMGAAFIAVLCALTAVAEEQQTAPRTVERTGEDPCTIKAEFRLALINPRTNAVLDTLLFAKAQPELQVSNNGVLGIEVHVIEVGPTPGALSFVFSRSAVGANAPVPSSKGPFRGGSLAALKAQMQGPDPQVDAPPSVKAGEPVVENVKTIATWTPQGHQSCSITEEVRVVWQFANPAATVAWTPPDTDPKHTAVSIGQTIAPEGKLYKVPVETFFLVANVKRCCNKPVGYAVIQFVRHIVQIEENPRKMSKNNQWSLDILDSEIQQAAAGNPYDPTYTHNPRGTDPNADPVVYPGPNGEGSASIVQVDKPGIPADLYDRLAKSGGSYTLQFHSFLLCELAPSNGKNYLDTGEVSQEVEYEIVITFSGSGAKPTVKGTLRSRTTHQPCEPLKKLLEALDKKAKNPQFIAGYEHPQPHQVRF